LRIGKNAGSSGDEFTASHCHLLPPCFPGKNNESCPENLAAKAIDFFREIGAGEANRTPDPNLGKVKSLGYDGSQAVTAV
jgi:hypothetical protein